MAKELPYFRFTIQEWQNGNVTLLNDSAQGVFINICCYYWSQDCDVTIKMLENRFKTKSKTIQKLIESESIKVQDAIVSISFLDQQLIELKQTKSFFSKMGKLGQKAKKDKAPLKTPPSYKDKDKDKDKDNKSFEIFWSFYPTRKGKKVGKGKSLSNFNKIPLSEIERLLRNTKNYASSCGDFAKDPERFLLNDFWQDWNTATEKAPRTEIEIYESKAKARAENELKRRLEAEKRSKAFDDEKTDEELDKEIEMKKQGLRGMGYNL